MKRFGFAIPLLAVLSANETDGNGIIYFAIFLMFFIIPEVMKLITKQSAIYSILKYIEKENNIIIYNGEKIETPKYK